MEVIRGIHNLRARHLGCVATIGNFDGVHHGHRVLLAHLAAKRDELRVPSVLVTFEPLPREYFLGASMPARLTRFREKVSLLARTGIDRLLCLPFNEALAATTAEWVIEDFLVRRMGVRYVVIGDDFRFGRGREGSYQMLAEAGQRHGFGVSHLGTLTFDHERVSSTRIREVLGEGNFVLAERLLGYPHFMMGRVAYGRQIGRTIGTPTANIPLHRYRPALNGVYAVSVEVQGEPGVAHPAVANVGIRPTVGGAIEPVLEVHLLDYSGDLYGRLMTTTFRHRIREERKFASLEALREQIVQDARTAREWFAARPPQAWMWLA